MALDIPSKNLPNSINESARLIRGSALKRILDFLLSFVAIIITLPLAILIALLIKIDSPGPVFYNQQRVGKNNTPFKLYKFRTMTLEGHPEKEEDYVQPQEHRIIRIGRFLRNTGMDEIPQFFNILKGDMSFVGPRPHATPQAEYYKKHVKNYPERYRVQPGLTGLVQISELRDEVNVEEQKKRILVDFYYINHWSLWLDLKILFQTTLILWPRYWKSVEIYGNTTENKTKKKG